MAHTHESSVFNAPGTKHKIFKRMNNENKKKKLVTRCSALRKAIANFYPMLHIKYKKYKKIVINSSLGILWV